MGKKLVLLIDEYVAGVARTYFSDLPEGDLRGYVLNEEQSAYWLANYRSPPEQSIGELEGAT